MFDFLRNLTKSAEEKRQEALSAYLDNALSPRERERVEAQLAQDPNLQAELEQQRLLKQSLRRLPQRRVPRNFTLDPALYGRPARQPLVQYYPALRAATVLTAFLFMFAVVAGLITQSGGLAQPAGIAQEAITAAESGEEAAFAPSEPEVALTREVEELESRPPATAASEAAEEAAPVEEVVEVEEEAVAEAEEALPAEEPAMAGAQEATDAVEGEGDGSPQGTALPAPGFVAPQGTVTSSPSPEATPISSTLPRLTATSIVSDRLQLDFNGDDASRIALTAIVTATLAAQPTTGAEETAVAALVPAPVPTPAIDQTLPAPAPARPWLQIVLLALLVVLATVTWYARRQL